MEEQQTHQTQTENYNKEFVDKLLNEKKNYAKAVEELKLKVNAYESKFKEIEQESLKAKEDWKTLAENSQKEALQYKQMLEQETSKRVSTLKMGALKREFEKMGLRDTKIIETLAPLVKLDTVRYDESTETVVGAEEEARRLKETLPQLFIAANNIKANHDSTQTVPVTYTVEKLQEMQKNKASVQEIREYQKGLMAQLVK